VLDAQRGALALFHPHTPCKQASGEGEKSRILSPARNKSAELWKRRSSRRIIKSIELQNESTAAALILQLQHHVRRFPKHLLADKWTCAYKELRRQYLAKKKRRTLAPINFMRHSFLFVLTDTSSSYFCELRRLALQPGLIFHAAILSP
jgi:hypothetical protein